METIKIRNLTMAELETIKAGLELLEVQGGVASRWAAKRIIENMLSRLLFMEKGDIVK